VVSNLRELFDDQSEALKDFSQADAVARYSGPVFFRG
jgi:hypothetical protein